MLSDDRMRHVRNPVFPLPLVVSDMPLDIDLPHSLHGTLDPTTGNFSGPQNILAYAPHRRATSAGSGKQSAAASVPCANNVVSVGWFVNIQRSVLVDGAEPRQEVGRHLGLPMQCTRHASSTEVFDVLRDPEPRKGHIVVHEAEHGVFEPTKDSIMSEGGDGKGTLNEGDLPTFVVPRLLEGADASFVTLADRAGCHEDVAWQPTYHPCNLHRSASCFDVSLVDPSIRLSYERSMYCTSNAGSPDWTPSPTTPINSYPSSLASLSPFPHFESDIQMMGMSTDTDSMRSEHMGWDDVKDSPWDMELFLDLDVEGTLDAFILSACFTTKAFFGDYGSTHESHQSNGEVGFNSMYLSRISIVPTICPNIELTTIVFSSLDPTTSSGIYGLTLGHRIVGHTTVTTSWEREEWRCRLPQCEKPRDKHGYNSQASLRDRAISGGEDNDGKNLSGSSGASAAKDIDLNLAASR
ncbi:hypothetical protein EV363DRAFT_1419829 [Boletus edulis]|nr:hypothetical protein EV363DRAFT_1419829 [Boletus edulis]